MLKLTALLTLACVVSLAAGCTFPAEDDGPLNVASTQWILGVVGNATVHVTFRNDGGENLTVAYADLFPRLMNQTGSGRPAGSRGGKVFDAEGHELEVSHDLVREDFNLSPRGEWILTLGFSYPNAEPSDFMNHHVAVEYRVADRSYEITAFLSCPNWLGLEIPRDSARMDGYWICDYSRKHRTD